MEVDIRDLGKVRDKDLGALSDGKHAFDIRVLFQIDGIERRKVEATAYRFVSAAIMGLGA